MKQLPFFKRPRGAKKILEIGPGHDPFKGITHAVDKFPNSNEHRERDLFVERGVMFKEGDFEKIPFDGIFDFMYASHVLEHVISPKKAVAEINRVCKKGFIETPSPVAEQIMSIKEFNRQGDTHKFFCWFSKNPDTIRVISKQKVFTFCDCLYGKTARALYEYSKNNSVNLEPVFPKVTKVSRIFFKTPVLVEEYASFADACNNGFCAFKGSVSSLFYKTGFLPSLFSTRYRRLRRILKQLAE